MCWKEVVSKTKTCKLYFGRPQESRYLDRKYGDVGGDRSVPGRKVWWKGTP